MSEVSKQILYINNAGVHGVNQHYFLVTVIVACLEVNVVVE